MYFANIVIGAMMVLGGSVGAQPITSFTELELILDDQIIIEDFEGISLHGGSTLDVPNPLNSVTVDQLPWNWVIEDGVTYESATRLAVHAGFIGGEDDVYLRSYDGIEIRFDVGQVAFGLDLIGFNTDNSYTIEVYDRADGLIESYEKPSNTGYFTGYQAPTTGISRVVITHSSFDFLSINNMTFGADFVACPADINEDGQQNFFDVSAFLSFFSEEDDRADFTDDGQFNFFDVSAFLNALTVSCP
ncbi:MAG: GC-type dockerin domain-anchored protein [Phycisphaerales bacterium]|nr:GC-type dockerin domain-anchored protein [Phycisphaerales bacterium]